jgi:hypothetical protein
MISKNAKSVLAMFALSIILIASSTVDNAYAGVSTSALRITASNNLGTDVITITDQGPMDNADDPVFGPGTITVDLNPGNFNACALFEGTTTFSKPILGNVMMPHMDTNWVATTVDTINGCDVTVEFTDTFFEASFPIKCVGSVGGTTNDTFLGYSVYSDDGNSQFVMTQQIFDTGILVPDVNNAYSGGGSGTGLVDGLYSLTMVLEQSHGPGDGVATSGDAELICEPSQVGGLEIPISSHALVLAGLNTSLVWILPAVIAAGGAAYYKFGRR